MVLYDVVLVSQATEDIPEVEHFPVQRSPSCPPQAGGLHTASSSSGGGTLIKKTVTRTVHKKEYDIDGNEIVSGPSSSNRYMKPNDAVSTSGHFVLVLCQIASFCVFGVVPE